MKKQLILFFVTGILFGFSYSVNSQNIDLKDLNSSNTWLKIGLNAGVPILDASDYSSFTLGLDANVQFLRTKAYGVGLKAGYVHFFGKDNNDDFGTIPLALLFRYYPESSGIFFGLEAGYAFVNNLPQLEGGSYLRPHIGWHTDSWNFFAYYDHLVGNEFINDIQSVGLGTSYNIYFK